MKVVFSWSAERNLEEIGDWIAADNPLRAISFVDELKTACKAIGRAPRAYPFVDRSRDLALRRKVYGNYLIFYDVGSEVVEILRVLHGSRDYARIIFPSEPE